MLKVYLINGARQFKTESKYPNKSLGYGASCPRDSNPGF
jgi:hypothetical protein